MLKKYLQPVALSNQVSLAVLILRVGFAVLMLPHGYAKMQEFLRGSHDFPDPLQVSPMVSQSLTIFAELLCSILLLLGLFTRPAALILAFCMFVVAFVIHWNEPLGEKEHGLLYFIGYVVVLLTGAGKYSLDAKVFK